MDNNFNDILGFKTFDVEESFKKHALTMMMLRQGVTFLYYSTDDAKVPLWRYKGTSVYCDKSFMGLSSFVWLMQKYNDKEKFCWILDFLNTQNISLWPRALNKTAEELIADMKRNLPEFKLGNEPNSVIRSLQYAWIDLHSILIFIDFCESMSKVQMDSVNVVGNIRDCSSVEELAKLFLNEFRTPNGQKKESNEDTSNNSSHKIAEVSGLQDRKFADNRKNREVVKVWSLLAFARENSEKGKVKIATFKNNETGKEFKAVAFVNSDGNMIYASFSKALGELTSQKLVAMKNELKVVLLDNGKYVICKLHTSDVEEVNIALRNRSKNESVPVSSNVVEIDLGLSVLWANVNVGASSETDSGLLFGYGDVSGKMTSELDEDYPSCGIVNTEFDIAKKHWGNGWRMPTTEELNELVEKCNWETMSKDGFCGMQFIGPNGNSIFLPFAGVRIGEGVCREDEIGCYWSGTRSKIESCVELMLMNGDASVASAPSSSWGICVRAVKDIIHSNTNRYSMLKEKFLYNDCDENEKKWTDEYGAEYSEDKKKLLDVPGQIKDYAILEGTEEICDYAFVNEEGDDISYSEIVERGETIWDHIYSTSELHSVFIPNSVVKIGKDIFRSCRYLESIYVPIGTRLKFEAMLPEFYKGIIAEKDENNIEQLSNFELPNGSLYTGGYVKKRSSVELYGHGNIAYPNGDSYEGTFKYGRPYGWGIYRFENGHSHKGYFDDKPNGVGYLNENYDMAVGNFQDGRLNGWAISYKNRIFKFGYWKNGRLVNDMTSYTLWVRYEISDLRLYYHGNLIQIDKEHKYIRFGVPERKINMGIDMTDAPRWPAIGFEFFNDGSVKIGEIRNNSSGNFILCKNDEAIEIGLWKYGEKITDKDLSCFQEPVEKYSVSGLNVYKI